MKIKVILFSFCLFLITGISVAQKKNAPKNIIRDKVAINKYHNTSELEGMQKGELLDLYIERIEVLVELLPYIAFATKPGVTMSTLGIPNDKENRKILEDRFDSTDNFLENNLEFQKSILPYSDTTDLISAVLYYEEILKSLHEYSEYH